MKGKCLSFFLRTNFINKSCYVSIIEQIAVYNQEDKKKEK